MEVEEIQCPVRAQLEKSGAAKFIWAEQRLGADLVTAGSCVADGWGTDPCSPSIPGTCLRYKPAAWSRLAALLFLCPSSLTPSSAVLPTVQLPLGNVPSLLCIDKAVFKT